MPIGIEGFGAKASNCLTTRSQQASLRASFVVKIREPHLALSSASVPRCRFGSDRMDRNRRATSRPSTPTTRCCWLDMPAPGQNCFGLSRSVRKLGSRATYAGGAQTRVRSGSPALLIAGRPIDEVERAARLPVNRNHHECDFFRAGETKRCAADGHAPSLEEGA